MPDPGTPRASLYALYHFLLWGASGIWWPFIFPFMAQRGVPFGQLGLLVAAWPVCAMVAQPLFGWLGDRTKRARWIQCLLTLAVAALIPAFGLVSGFRGELGVSLAFAFCNAPVGPLADALTVAYVREAGGDYGRLRLWGSLSFALAGLAAGWAVARGLVSLAGLLRIGALLTVPAALLPLAFPVELHSGPRARTDLRQLTRARPLLWLLGLCALNVIPMNAHSTYFSLYLTRLGGTAASQGAGWALPAFAEVPFFLWGSAIERRLGMRRTLFLGFTCLTASLSVIALAHSPQVAVAGAVLQGPAFGLFYGAAVPAVDRLAPAGLRASGQSLLWAACFGLGSVTANLGAGWGAASLGAQGLFRALAAFSWMALGLYAAVAQRAIPLGGQAPAPDH